MVGRVDEELELRVLEEGDAVPLAGLSEGYHAQPQVNEWWFSGGTSEAATHFIREQREKQARDEGLGTGVWYRGELAGIVILSLRGLVPSPQKRTASLDYGLAPAFRGKGIMTRSCTFLRDYVFERHAIGRLEIHADAANVKSCAVPERLGMRREGILRQAVWYGSFYGDIVVYALLRSEWEALKKERGARISAGGEAHTTGGSCQTR